jgi:hypothetical protein
LRALLASHLFIALDALSQHWYYLLIVESPKKRSIDQKRRAIRGLHTHSDRSIERSMHGGVEQSEHTDRII